MPTITLTGRDSQSLSFIKGVDRETQGYLIISEEMFTTFFNPFQTKQQGSCKDWRILLTHSLMVFINKIPIFIKFLLFLLSIDSHLHQICEATDNQLQNL